MQRTWRTAVVVALAQALVLSSLLAPEHVHEADDHHSAAVAHRHIAAHDHDDSAMSHDEGRVLWLDSHAVQRATYHLGIHIGVLPAGFDKLSHSIAWIATSTLDAAPAHGPPRATASLRAPPAPPSSTI